MKELDEIASVCSTVYRLMGRYATHDPELQVDRVMFGFLAGRYGGGCRQFPVRLGERRGRIDFFVTGLGPSAIELAVRRLDEGESRLLPKANESELEKLRAVDPLAARRVLVLMDFGRRQIPTDTLKVAYGEATRDDAVPIHILYVRGMKADYVGDRAGDDIEPNGYSAMRHVFAAEGLPPPPVPEGLRPHVRYLEDWLFSTDEGSWRQDLYEMRPALQRFLKDGERSPRFTVGHAGHGVNSYTIGYQLVSDEVALFVQCFYGGIYMNRERSILRIAEAFGACDRIIRASRPPRRPGHLVVLESDIVGASIGWVGPEERPRTRAWLAERTLRRSSLEAAIERLAE